MRIYKSFVHIILPALLTIILVFCACDDNPVDSSDIISNFKELRIVVTENATNTPLGGVSLIIDGKSELSCITDEDTGDCFFRLTTSRHLIKLSKASYTTVEAGFDFTSSMTVKYFTLFKSGV